MKDGGEAVDLFFEQRFERFHRHVAAGETSAAGGDDGVDVGIVDPGFHLGADFRDVGGLKIPFKITITQNGQRYADVTVSAYKFDTGLTSAELQKRP